MQAETASNQGVLFKCVDVIAHEQDFTKAFPLPGEKA